MRELYNEFFHISRHGKIREKVMLVRVVMTVVIIVACLAAMSITAYAYFSYDVTSGSNTIKSAYFETNVSVTITDENVTSLDINPVTDNYQTQKVELKAGKQYTVTIAPTTNSNAKTGFVVVTADGCNEIYHTQQLGVDTKASGGETQSISFKLTVTDNTKVKFSAHWGTSTYYDDYKNKGDNEELYITQDEEIKMIVNGIIDPVDENNENTQAEEDTTVTEQLPKENEQ